MTPLERDVQAKIVRYLRSLPGCVFFKVHGGPYGAGQPDLVGCYRGRAFALEVKRPGGRLTTLQAAILERWRQAGAIAARVESVDEVRELLAEEANA